MSLKKIIFVIISSILILIETSTVLLTLTVGKNPSQSGDKTFTSFEIKDDNIPTNLTTGYSATNWIQTVSTSPTADSIDYSFSSIDSELSAKISVYNIPGFSTTGVKLGLDTGLIAGTYSYTIHGVAHKAGYTDATYDKACSLTIGNGTFSAFTIESNNIPTTLTTGYSATSWTQTVSTTPTADSIDYSVTNVDTGLSGKLSVDSSSTVSGVKLNLATGVAVGTYSYTVHGVAHKSGYTDATYDKTCSLTIGNATFSTFTINNNNIPTSLVTGYSATSWTQSVSTTPVADSIDYSVTNVDTGLSGKLSVDSSSTVSGVKLNLATGVAVGTYAYTVHGVAHKSGYTDATYDKTCSLTIGNATFSAFTINNNNIPTNLTYGYSASSWTQTASTTPTADSIDYSVTNVDTGLSGKLSVDSSSTVSGVKLNLATGVAVGTYAYTVHGVAHKSGYTDATYDKTCSLTISTLPIPTPTWTTPDTFTYDGNSHSISVNSSSLPSGATVTYSGGETNSNSATTGGSYTITAHVVVTNYTTTDFTHTLTIKQSNIKLQNGTTYYINTSYNNFCTTRTDSGAFNFRDSTGTDRSITRTDIEEIHLVDLPQISTAPDSYLMYMCYGMTNLTIAEIEIPTTIDSCGVGFCAGFFYNCTSLNQINTNFTLPQNITSVGNYFCYDMFYHCNSLTNISQVFSLPQSITGSVGDGFCNNMFYDCNSLRNLPSGFNIPSGITTAGGNFCASMFYQCTNFLSLPINFNLPQSITTVGTNFCASMFEDCSSLNNDLPSVVTIHIPSPSTTGAYFCDNMFNNTLTSNPATPSPNTDVTVNQN